MDRFIVNTMQNQYLAELNLKSSMDRFIVELFNDKFFDIYI